MYVREQDTTLEQLAVAMTAESMTETTTSDSTVCREELMLLNESTRVSRITLLPGGRLASRTLDNSVVQWMVVTGNGRVRIAQGERMVTTGDYILIPSMALHAAEVVGDEPLVLTEVRIRTLGDANEGIKM